MRKNSNKRLIAVATVLLLWVIFKVYSIFKFLFGWIPDNKDDNQKKKE